MALKKDKLKSQLSSAINAQPDATPPHADARAIDSITKSESAKMGEKIEDKKGFVNAKKVKRADTKKAEKIEKELTKKVKRLKSSPYAFAELKPILKTALLLNKWLTETKKALTT